MNFKLSVKRRVQLSRTISHALRHEPWLYDLKLSEDGWVDVEALLEALRRRSSSWLQISEQDIAMVVESSDKQRFELREDRIRALYGHSTPERMRKTAAEPPIVLYHGTSPETAQIILAEGLKPMERQYVHLSADQETARQVGSRKSRAAVILEVAAAQAHAEGVVFYLGSGKVWLADSVPASFVRQA